MRLMAPNCGHLLPLSCLCFRPSVHIPTSALPTYPPSRSFIHPPAYPPTFTKQPLCTRHCAESGRHRDASHRVPGVKSSHSRVGRRYWPERGKSRVRSVGIQEGPGGLGRDQGGQHSPSDPCNEDHGLLPLTIQDRCVSMRAYRASDLRRGLGATGICDVTFSIAGFAAAESEREGRKEGRRKQGPASPRAHRCVQSQPSASWAAGCVRGRHTALGMAAWWHALPPQWWRLAGTGLLSDRLVSILRRRAEWSLRVRWLTAPPSEVVQ